MRASCLAAAVSNRLVTFLEQVPPIRLATHENRGDRSIKELSHVAHLFYF